MKGEHKQVKINDDIWVDADIAALVQVLNEFENVETVDSCQGGKDSPAYVYFIYRGNHQSFADFIQKTQEKLRTKLNLCCEYKFRLEWLASSENPMAELIVQPAYAETVASALRETNVFRKSRSHDDRLRTMLHS